MANQGQIDQWNGPAADKWIRLQSTMDQLFVAHGKALSDEAKLRAGEAVLDVGCGCGATSLEAARSVGASGNVLGVDVSAPMLARAVERAAEERLDNVRFERTDAQTHALAAGAFDVVVSRLGVMFFDDPVAAFSNFRNALRENGRLAFVCWQATTENPWISIPMRAVSSIVPVEPMDGDKPGPFSFANAARIERVLKDSNFTAVRIEPLSIPLNFGAADQAADLIVTTGPTGRALLGVDAATRARAARAVADALAEVVQSAEVVLASKGWLVSARRGPAA